MIFDTDSSRFVRSLIRYRLFFSCPVFQLEILKILIKKGLFRRPWVGLHSIR